MFATVPADAAHASPPVRLIHAAVRRFDVWTMWSHIRDTAHTPEQARDDFLRHAASSPAWRSLGEDAMLRAIRALG